MIFAHDLSAALASLALAFLLREGGHSIWADARCLAYAVPLFLARPGHRSSPSVCIGASGATPRSAISARSQRRRPGRFSFRRDRPGGRPDDRGAARGMGEPMAHPDRAPAAPARVPVREIHGPRAGGCLAPPMTRDVPAAVWLRPHGVPVRGRGPGRRRRPTCAGGRHPDDPGIPRGRYVHDVPVLGAPQDLDRIVAELAVQGIQPQRLVMTRPADGLAPEVRTFAERCRARYGLELHFCPTCWACRPARCRREAAVRARLLPRPPPRRGEPQPLALLLLMPLLALIALAVLVDQGRPILFRQLRPGRGMRPFTLYKFRTMRGPCDRHGASSRTPSGRRRSAARCGACGSTSFLSSSTWCAATCHSSARGRCWRATSRTGFPSASRSAPASPAGPRCTAASS